MTTAIKNATPDINDAVEQVTVLNARIVDAGKRVGNVYLDGAEKTVAAAINAQRKLAEKAQPDVVRTLVEAQADLTAELTKTYTTTVREVLA